MGRQLRACPIFLVKDESTGGRISVIASPERCSSPLSFAFWPIRHNEAISLPYHPT
jgi:hypothetical protein